MEFYNIHDAPKSHEAVFKEKPKQTGVGFVSIGTRIRGLLTKNQLDLSGVNVSDDYDIPPDKDDKEYLNDVSYDESQDFMDKLDAADKIETVSSKLNKSVEEQVSSKLSTSKKNKITSDSEGIFQPASTAEGGTE